jgi:signal transduction histidine kinase
MTNYDELHALFVASSLHEAKNHANHLLIHVDQLASQFSLTTEDTRLQPIQQDCQNLLHHLTLILQLYKSNQGYRLHREDIILEDFFEDIQIRHRTIDIQQDIDGDLTAVFDQQLILNIMDTAIYNALQAGASVLKLQASRTENHLQINIDDNGPGFPEALLSRSLDQLKPSDLAQHKTGLGLYMAHQIMQAHQHQDRHGYLHLSNASSLGGGRLSLFLP